MNNLRTICLLEVRRVYFSLFSLFPSFSPSFARLHIQLPLSSLIACSVCIPSPHGKCKLIDDIRTSCRSVFAIRSLGTLESVLKSNKSRPIHSRNARINAFDRPSHQQVQAMQTSVEKIECCLRSLPLVHMSPSLPSIAA